MVEIRGGGGLCLVFVLELWYGVRFGLEYLEFRDGPKCLI